MRLRTNTLTTIALLLCVALPATDAVAQTKKKTSSTAPVTADDIRELREMLEQQQQQIRELQQQLLQRDEQAHQAQAAAQQAQEAAQAAAQKAQAAESAINNNSDSFTKMQSDVADLKTNVGNVAMNSQDTDKRIAAAEGLASRFRFSGDIRVRGESFIQSYAGCGAACNDRNRARIRVRLGIDGKLNEDFFGGLALATGANVNAGANFADPTSTNQTLTDFFERKTIGLDRGFVTYNPHQFKPLTLTGGKFAYTWNRSPLTFDSDINPEGFNAKLNFDLHNPFFKNFNVQGIGLMYNEVSAGTDSNAVGMSASGKIQLGRLVTYTPTYTILNWNGSDAIAQAAAPVTLPNPNTTPVGTPTATPTTQPVRIINANAFTNSSVIIGTGTSQRRGFLSDFMYSDFLNDFSIVTPFKSYPLRVIADYVKNLRARPVAPGSGKQDQGYWLEASLGQQKNKHDLQFGYSFADIDQDAVISQFNESDMRAPTNVKQHRLFLNWLVMSNTTAAFTLWHGKTKYSAAQNASRAPGLAAGAEDPFLNRMHIPQPHAVRHHLQVLGPNLFLELAPDQPVRRFFILRSDRLVHI
jgi:hypothetical protein